VDTEGKSGFHSFLARAVRLAVVAVVVALLIRRLHPELMPRLKERMMRCCCGSEGMRACMENCGCGKPAERAPETEAAPGE
jgi:hypothetical protein